MRIEHIGMQVEDPVAMCDWYCRNLGFRAVRTQDAMPFTMFLADSADAMMLEIHRHEEVPIPVPDYRAMDPLVLHLAFDVGEEPIETVAARLIAAGATEAKGMVVTALGDKLMMLRDPWGTSVQLVRRAKQMTKGESHA